MGPMSDEERAPRNVDEQAALRAVVEGTAGDTGVEFFAALVKNLARALDVHGAWVTVDASGNFWVRTLAESRKPPCTPRPTKPLDGSPAGIPWA